MKVILLQELKGKGGEGDVVDVAPGFANNYLMPQGHRHPGYEGQPEAAGDAQEQHRQARGYSSGRC